MTGANDHHKVSAEGGPQRETGPATHASPLHRLYRVRLQEGISRRTVARRLDLSVDDVKRQELETTDVPLSVLYKWRDVLEVPLVDLLREPEHLLSPEVMDRAHMVRVMKTAKYILESAKQVGVKRMAQTLVDQLIEIMPELQEVSAWHHVGRRRRHDEYGRVAELQLPDELFFDFRD